MSNVLIMFDSPTKVLHSVSTYPLILLILLRCNKKIPNGVMLGKVPHSPVKLCKLVRNENKNMLRDARKYIH